MQHENLSIDQAIDLIIADGQKDEKLLTDLERLKSKIEYLESRKAAGTISAEELEKEFQAIGEQLDQIIDEDMKAEHPDYDSLLKAIREK